MKFLRSQVIIFSVLMTANLIPSIIGSESGSVSEKASESVTVPVTVVEEPVPVPVSNASSTSEEPQPIQIETTSTTSLPTPPVTNNTQTQTQTTNESVPVSSSASVIEVLEPIPFIENVQLIQVPAESLGNTDTDPSSSSIGSSNDSPWETYDDDHNAAVDGPQHILTLVPVSQLSSVNIQVDDDSEGGSEIISETVQEAPLRVEAVGFPDSEIAIITNVNEPENVNTNENDNDTENLSSDEIGNLAEDIFGPGVEIKREDENENAIVAVTETKSSTSRAMPVGSGGSGKFRSRPSLNSASSSSLSKSTTTGFRQAPISLYIGAKPQPQQYGYYGYNSRPRRPQWGNNYNNNYYGNRFGYGNGNGYAQPAPFNNYYGPGYNSYNSLYASSGPGNGYGYNNNRFTNRPGNYYGNRYQPPAIALSLGKK